MTTYESHESYIKDQIRSYRWAEKRIKKIQKEVLETYLDDFYGDKNKVILALDEAIKFLKIEQQKLHQP